VEKSLAKLVYEHLAGFSLKILVLLSQVPKALLHSPNPLCDSGATFKCRSDQFLEVACTLSIS
jgi:hypothetical protein